MVPTKRRAHRWGKNARLAYSNRAQELHAAWRRVWTLDSLKRHFKDPWRFSLSSLKRRSSMDYEDYDRTWRGSAIGLYKCASQGDESVFEDTRPDTASRNGDLTPGSTKPRKMEDPPTQVSSPPCLSAAGALNKPSLNLCHQGAGINAENLSAELGYEHGLLSELPIRDKLEQLQEWPNRSTGLCKLCCADRWGLTQAGCFAVESTQA